MNSTTNNEQKSWLAHKNKRNTTLRIGHANVFKTFDIEDLLQRRIYISLWDFFFLKYTLGLVQIFLF